MLLENRYPQKIFTDVAKEAAWILGSMQWERQW